MSLLINRPERRKSPTILVPLESFLYLQEKSYIERCGKHHTEKMKQRLIRNFETFSHSEKKQLMNGDLGGCNGDPENTFEEGRWTSWSVDDMAEILDGAGLPFERGESVEYIAL